MTTDNLILAGVDLLAALILVFGIYYRRHRRQDLVVAFMGVNVGVLAVATVLNTTEIAMGLGLGLFGVLSIIRLRSSEISQREVAYYFAVLAMGLIGGLASTNLAVPSALIALIVIVMWIVDNPLLLSRSRHQVIRLDRAIFDEDELLDELTERLDAHITSFTVQQTDMVNDSMLVDIRYQIATTRSAHPTARTGHDNRSGVPA